MANSLPRVNEKLTQLNSWWPLQIEEKTFCLVELKIGINELMSEQEIFAQMY